jgi:hypothetical protein
LTSVPLYITEFGWTTSPPHALHWLPERLRPGFIARTISALGRVDCGLRAMLLYTWVTPERNRRDPEDWFGVHGPRGGSTLDSSAFAIGIREGRTGTRITLCGPV